jgi:hypothetical protein
VKKQWIAFFALIAVIVPAASHAEQFAVVGPRALGMGGASVAAVNDSTAVYWNPAALADFRRVDIRMPAEAGFADHAGLKDTWSMIDNINARIQAGDPAAINEAISLLQNLDKPHTGADINASAGLLISIPIAKSAIAVSALEFGYAGLYPTIDTLHLGSNPGTPATFVGDNDSVVTGIGIVAKEPAVSFATSFADKVFIGANAKMIYADTYVNTQFLKSNSFNTFVDDLKQNKTGSNKASFDAGILYVPVESFRLGVVGRELNSPSFAVDGVFAQKLGNGDVGTALRIDEVKFNPQYRAGVAWLPLQTLTLAADYDLTGNKTLTPGYENRTVAVGLEKTFLHEYFNVRLGANKNLAESGEKRVYTGGVGLRLFAFRLDLAGAYDFDKRQYQASLDMALRF